MRLLTRQQKSIMPQLRAADCVVQCKYTASDSNWPWYVFEFDGLDRFLGDVNGTGPKPPSVIRGVPR